MEPRIVTLTMNPALDIASTAEEVMTNHKVRTRGERYDPGGGGINVARVLHRLGGTTLAVILTGDVTGRLIEELLDAEEVTWRRIGIAGRTRISFTVHDDRSGEEYRFVAEGPELAEPEWQAALDLLETIEADWLVASGSLPCGVPADFYTRAARLARGRGMRFALDTSGAGLQHGLGAGVDLLKLSQRELASLAGRALPTPQDEAAEMRALIARGQAEAIAVTRGAQGAALARAREVREHPAIPVKARSSVGAGDAFLAGLVLALARGEPDVEALDHALAAGAAAVRGFGTALVQAEDVAALRAKPR